MKTIFHVFSRMFTKKVGEPVEPAKVNLFLFLLFSLLAVPSAWADNIDITSNGQIVRPPCSEDRKLTVASGVTSFVIKYPSIPADYAYSCSGKLYVDAPSGYTLSLSGEAKLRNGSYLYIYDGSETSDYLYVKNGSDSNTDPTLPTLYTSDNQATILFSHNGHIDNTNYVDLNVSVHAFHYASVSIPWEKNKPWLYYQIWEKATSFYLDPWEETESGYYESNPVKFYVGRNIYLKNNRGNMSIWGINVKDANGNLLPVRVLETGEYATGALYPSTSYLDRCLWFKMPESDVVVVPTYASYPSYSFDEIPRGFGYNLVNESRAVRVDSSIHVFDDGGIDYKYANNFDGYLTVTAHKGLRVKVTGTVATEEGGYDYLEVFEGKKGESTTPICKVYSASRNVAVAVPDKCKSADSVLTLHFKTDSSIFADGLDLVVSAEAVTYKVELNNNQTSYGTISTDKTSSPPGYTVTLTAHPKSGYVLKSVSVINTATNATVTTSGGRETDNKITFTMPAGNVRVTPTFVKDTYSITKTTGAGGSLDVASSAKVGTTVTMEAKPQSGYMVRNIEVVAKNGDAVKVDGGWYNDEKASFIMPLSDVTVKSTYTNNLTAGDGGLYINMPTTGTVNATIPKEVKSFKVYDDGGKDGNYSSGGILTLTAPEGYVLQVTGSIDLAKHNCWMEYCYDSLYVYDGVGIDSKKLYSGRETVNDIGRNMSSGRSMTIQFKGYARDGIASGLDLTVSLHKLDMELEKDNNGNYYVDMLVRNATTLKIPKGITSFKVYDDGGKDGDYSDNFSGILTLTAPEGCVLQLTGSINLAKTPGMYTYYYDYLYVYDGADIDSDILYSAKETVNDIGKKMSSGRSLTIRFSGISDDVASGLDLTVKVISVENQITYKNMNSGGTIASSSPTTGEMYKTVEYTYNFNSGYLVRDIEVIAENGDAVKASGGWYTQKTAAFKMPPCNVTVKSTYTNNLTAAGGLYINMPTTGTVNATIPEGVKSFKVYDDGGKDGNYSSGSRGILTLTAPEGYVLQVTGSIDLGKYAGFLAFDYVYDSLYVYDGVGIDSEKLYSARETVNDIGKRMSSGRSMTILLSSYSDGASGIDLTVTLHKLDMELQKDNNGNYYVNMLLKNAATLKIPKGVESFNVYDEGGEDGDYSTYFDGSLTLTAPEGYVLQVTGSIKLARFMGLTDYAYDLLNVYDGADINSDRLYSGRETVDDIGLHTSSGHNMTIRFEKNGSPSFAPGFDLTVTLIPVEYTISDNKLLCAIFKQCVSANKSSGYVGDTVYLTANNDKEDYVLEKFIVRDANKNTVPVIRNTLTKAFFVMPASNVQVDQGTSYFDTEVSADKGFHLDLARNGKRVIDFHSGVKSFNLYDDGGAFGDYSINSDDTLVVTAPEGYHFKMTGKIYTDFFDNLDVYDGASPKATKLFSRGGMVASEAYSVGTIKTSSNSMTVYFHSDGSIVSSGLDLLVSIEPDSYAISVAKVDNGRVISKKATAIAGELVILTMKPSGGFYLNACTVMDVTNNPILYTFNPADTTVSFTMPKGPVTVTPEFTSLPNIDVVSVSGGRVQKEISLANEFKLNATLTATPDDGFIFNGASVVDADDKTVTVNNDSAWYSNVATFKLAKNVTVTPKFVKELSADDEIFVNMPRLGETRINIPRGVKSFNVYDNGGKSGKCSRGANGTVVLSAPDDYILHVAIASMNTNMNDHLIIYDGVAVDNANVLLDVSGTDTGPIISSSGNSITMHFEPSRSTVGFEILVTLVPVYYAVTVATVTGGSMTSDKETAIMDGKVTLTAKPDYGYVLESVEVKDADNNILAVNGGVWYSGNKATFTMPASGVTVTPKFTDELTNLYVKIPKSGAVPVYVPVSVASFKVYDDSENYGNSAYGKLWITSVSSFYTVRVTGKASLQSGNRLTINHGSLSTYEGSPLFTPFGTLYKYEGSTTTEEVDVGEHTAMAVLEIDLSASNFGNASSLDLTVSKERTDYGAVSLVFVDGIEENSFGAMLISYMEDQTGFKIPDGAKSVAYIDGDYTKPDAVHIEKEITVDAVMYAREFPTGTFSTMVLPFSVNTENVEGLDAVLRYNGIKTVDGKSSIRMKVVWATDDWVSANKIMDSQGKSVHYDHTDLNANTPYLVQMKQEKLIVNGGVTLMQTAPADTSIDGWTFRGTWEYKMWEEGDPELGYAYGFAASESKENNIDVGDFVKVGKGAWIRPMRAYLVKTEIPPKVQGVRANGNYVMRPSFAQEELPELMSIIIDDEDGDGKQTTVIGHFNTRTGEIKMNNAATKRTFDVKGRNVGDKANKARGAYYGKKILK